MNDNRRKWMALYKQQMAHPSPEIAQRFAAALEQTPPPRYMTCIDPTDHSTTWRVVVECWPDPEDPSQHQWSWTGRKVTSDEDCREDSTYQWGFSSADEAEASARHWFRVQDLGTLDIGSPIPDVPRHPGWFRLEIRTPSRKHPHGRTVVGRTWYVNRIIRDWMVAHSIRQQRSDGLREERIVSLTPLDIGFDPRAHDMAIMLPPELDGLRLERGGRTYTVRGTREQLIAAASDAGYRIVE